MSHTPDRTPPDRTRHTDAGVSCAHFAGAMREHQRRAASRARGPGAIASLDSLHAHLQTCPSCASRHGRRLTDLRAREAIRRRELPVDSLEGFYDELRERIPFTAPGGGMSAAFLDAPRSLRLWRSAALAASLLLAVGAGIVTWGGYAGGDAGSRARPLHDPRDDLLPTFQGRETSPARSSFFVRPVHAPLPRGHARFFEPAANAPFFPEEEEDERDVRLR